MDKKYFSKLIARDQQGLSLISAYCSESDVRISNIKYLKHVPYFSMQSLLALSIFPRHGRER